jgi:hypothetical protein
VRLPPLNHVPDKYEHLVRYYGYYANRAIGARRLAEQEHDTSASIVIERILKHLNVCSPLPEPLMASGPDPPWPKGESLPITYHPVPDIA